MDARKLVGWNLRRLRVERDLTLEELSHQADLSASYLGHVERGAANSSVDKLSKLAKAMRVKMADLFIDPPQGAQRPKPLPAGRKSNKK